MELRELRTFCTAAKLRSISKAADALGIAQPTASTHIRKLEAELGTSLFHRVKRPIQVTLAGFNLAQLATPLVDGIDALAVRTAMGAEVGPVWVAAIADIIPHILRRVVREFLLQYPHVQLRMRSATREAALKMVEDGDVDIGVVATPEMDPTFDFQPMFSYDRVLITPLGHPLSQEPVTSLEQIARYPLVLRSRASYTRTLLEAEFKRKGIAYNIVVELDTMDMIKPYVTMGMGVSVGPRLAFEPEDERTLGIVSLSNLLPVEQGGVVTRRGGSLSVPAQNFIAAMEGLLRPPSARAR